MVAANRIETLFPEEATQLRKAAIEYRRMERALNECVAEAQQEANVAEQQARYNNAIYLATRASRKECRMADKLANTIAMGAILPNQDTSVDLQRICAEWAKANHR